MPFDRASKGIRLMVWLILFCFCVGFWWVLVERYGVFVIAVFVAFVVALLLILAALEYAGNRDTSTPGVCQHCGCTENRACVGGCAWIDETRTCCDAPLCQMRRAAGL